MNQKNIVILTDGMSYEAWGSLKELCKVHYLSYNYLKRLKFPFKYKGMVFTRVPFRRNNGVIPMVMRSGVGASQLADAVKQQQDLAVWVWEQNKNKEE